ncbi:MAG TPA: hypothetical protein VKZ49_14960 [Polyangiaceae bacterium]|nr:hypothetical protein [Polyangiaceae bacterium]
MPGVRSRWKPWAAVIALIGAGSGCARAEAKHRERTAERDPGHAAAVESTRLRGVQRRLADRFTRPLPRPVERELGACPKLALTDPAARELVLTVDDARVEAKTLLPLALTRRLTTAQWERVRTEDEWGNDASPLAALDPARARAELDRLERLRYRAVFFVTGFVHPRVIRRIDRPKPQWVAGQLVGKLVLFDMDGSRPLCDTLVSVQNDVSAAPISRRLRAQTRDALVDDLADRFRRAAPAAVARLAPELQLVFD